MNRALKARNDPGLAFSNMMTIARRLFRTFSAPSVVFRNPGAVPQAITFWAFGPADWAALVKVARPNRRGQ